MKKRIASLFLACVMMVGVGLAVFAEEKTYSIPDMNMEISVGDGWYVFTRDMAEDDPALEMLGVTRDQIVEQMSSDNNYFDCITADGAFELVIRMVESSESKQAFDLNNYTSLEVQQFSLGMVAGMEEIDATEVTDEGQYTHDQALFCDISMKMPANQGGDDAYVRATIINGQSIVMGLYSLDGSEIDQTMLDEFNAITDSIYFTQVLSPSGGTTSTPAANSGAAAPAASSGSWIMLVVVVLAVVLVIVIILVVVNNRKKQQAILNHTTVYPDMQVHEPGHPTTLDGEQVAHSSSTIDGAQVAPSTAEDPQLRKQAAINQANTLHQSGLIDDEELARRLNDIENGNF